MNLVTYVNETEHFIIMMASDKNSWFNQTRKRMSSKSITITFMSLHVIQCFCFF